MPDNEQWYTTPDALLAELQRTDLQFDRTIEIRGYDDIRELGRGGQGVIYTATQRSTKREVAIKVLYDSPLGVSTRRLRFEREIDLVSHLQHPNIVRVYDSGVTGDGRMYVVMERITGTTLGADRTRTDPPSGPSSAVTLQPETSPRRPSDLPDTLELFIKICGAVNYSHQRGVIHRDLKPSNVIIDTQGEPHVLDFGVAKATEPQGAFDTASGQFMGTLAYAAPEQIDGPPDDVDTRCDVYALGVLLYELLTGRLPYVVDGPVGQAIAAITTATITPPSRLGVGDDELDTIVMTALARDPERRYQTAATLRDDCRRYLNNEPLEARRDSRWYLFRKFIARHRGAVTVAATFIVMLVGFGTGMTTAYTRARTEADKFRAINAFLEDTLYALDVDPEQPVTLEQLLDASEPWMDSTLADDPAVEAAIRTTIGKSYLSLGLFDKADQHINSGLDIRRALYDDPHPDIAKSLATLAQLHHMRGDVTEAEALHRQALDMRLDYHGPLHSDVAMSLGNLAILARERGNIDEALEMFDRQLALREQLYGIPHATVALVHFNRGATLETSGRLEEALAAYRRALDQRRALLAEDHPDLARTTRAFARVQNQVERTTEPGD